MHLDHKNGVNTDNRLENLRFLCPNCHSLTDTYCGKKLSGKTKEQRNCIDCNIQISFNSTRCRKCERITRIGKHDKIIWPETPTLIEMSIELGYEEVGRKLGVSGNAVKFRIQKYQKRFIGGTGRA